MSLNLSELSQFVGSTTLHKHWLGIEYTDGVRFLTDKAQAHWLVDAIASHQTKKLLQNPKLRDFQLWELTVNEDKSANLACFEDTDCPEMVSQTIEYTDFSMPSIKLYLIDKVLMLPNEY